MASAIAPPLAGKVAIVTGGSSGLGFDIVVALATAGAKVAIVCTSQCSTTAAEAIVGHINSLFPTDEADPANAYTPAALSIQADLCNPASFPTIVSKALTLSPTSTINIIINNAANQIPQAIANITPEDFTDTYTLNVLAPILLLQAAISHLAPNSRIINISTAKGRFAFKDLSLYCSSKAALEGLTRSWAVELVENGTTVNAIAPGPMPTDTIPTNTIPTVTIPTDTLDTLPEDIKRWYQEAKPVEHRFGGKDEVSNVVVWLAGDGSSWVSGQTINVSGG